MICIRDNKKQGWGKINKEGNIEYFVLKDIYDSLRDELIIKAFSELLKIKTGQIEIFSGRQDRMIVTILGVNSDQVDLVISTLK